MILSMRLKVSIYSLYFSIKGKKKFQDNFKTLSLCGLLEFLGVLHGGDTRIRTGTSRICNPVH